MIGWLYFLLSQVVSIVATLIGYLLLLPFCLAQAWETNPVPSIGQKSWLTRGPIDRWRWAPLNRFYGNPEDGVSGQTALIWGSGTDAGRLVSYMPGASAWWRAYCWSALRNSADQVKYTFRWCWACKPAPLYKAGSFKLFGRTWQYGFGWKLENDFYYVPVVNFKAG